MAEQSPWSQRQALFIWFSPTTKSQNAQGWHADMYELLTYCSLTGNWSFTVHRFDCCLQICYSTSYITDCVEKGQILHPLSYAAFVRPMAGRRSGYNKYTEGEDTDILDYVKKHGGPHGHFSPKGNKFWVFAVLDLNSVHSWQSMKNRWRKVLCTEDLPRPQGNPAAPKYRSFVFSSSGVQTKAEPEFSGMRLFIHPDFGMIF